jgi:2-polyprenyl-3-methyl-5-hydroxy-6-metoxy-1,4-benzoquinol methylase
LLVGKATQDVAGGAHKSYDPEFFAKLADVESRHFWFRTRNQVITGLTQQFAKDWSDGYRVLEVGCGTGNVLQALEKACSRGVVVGMDLFAEGLAFARKRTSCGLVQGDVEQPAFGVPFDVIGAFDVIEHLPDDLRILRSLHAMLRPAGVLLVTVPAYRSLWSYFDEASHHCRRYEPGDLRQKLNQAGFEVEFLSPFMASVYPLMWLVRRIGSLRRRGKTPSAESDLLLTLQELRIVPVLNGLLTFVLRQEARLIQARMVLPFGSSLIAAARRKQ